MSDLALLARIMGFILGLVLIGGAFGYAIQTAIEEQEISCQVWQAELTDCRSLNNPGFHCLTSLRDRRPTSCPLPESD